jgi:hypothetical protein
MKRGAQPKEQRPPPQLLHECCITLEQCSTKLTRLIDGPNGQLRPASAASGSLTRLPMQQKAIFKATCEAICLAFLTADGSLPSARYRIAISNEKVTKSWTGTSGSVDSCTHREWLVEREHLGVGSRSAPTRPLLLAALAIARAVIVSDQPRRCRQRSEASLFASSRRQSR